MPVRAELLLPQIQEIKAPIFSPHPEQAAPVLID
jgi:hypothetical protein